MWGDLFLFAGIMAGVVAIATIGVACLNVNFEPVGKE